jgi:MFS transporter, DHA2 family, multidrug resistance protein
VSATPESVAGGSRAQHFLLTLAVMSATVMQALDTTIVNVALPHMQGDLGATPEQITWVLTSYLVASGIFMPLTGYFTDRFGQKRYLVYSIAGFVLASGLCGIVTNLPEIVLFRLLQGVFGAALVPLSQSIMVQTVPPSQRGRAMAIWGIGVMVGPIMGPTLGGYLTDMFNWRWTFYINLPVGVLSLLLAARTVPDTPRRERPMDWRGLALLAVAISALQFTLDYGNQDDWFESRSIQIAVALCVGGFAWFLYHAFTHRGPTLFHLNIFRDRNFATATALMSLFGLGLYGAMVLQPMLLESLLNYPTATTGWMMAPRGFASMVSMMLVGRLINRVQPRLLVLSGLVIGAVGSWSMTRYTLDIGAWSLVWPVLVQGFGLGLVFVPLSTVAFATLAREQSAEAAGVYSLTRTIGSSIGISVIATMMTREAQVAWNQLGGRINPFNPALAHYLSVLGLRADDPRAAALLAHELGRQAQMLGMVDAFVLVMWSFVLMLPFVLLLGRMSHHDGEPAAAAVSD